jgi:hypothetical protein
MKIVKVTNPNALPVIAPRISEYCKILDVPGVQYENLYASFCQAVQFGGDNAEFFVVLDDHDTPVAFALWKVMGLPYAGTVCFEHIYKWCKGTAEPFNLLIKEFTAFYKRKRATIGFCNPLNEPLSRLFKKYAADNSFGCSEKNMIYLALKLSDGEGTKNE